MEPVHFGELRRRLIGADFADVKVERVLCAGSTSAVFAVDVLGAKAALKIVYNYGATTTMVGDLLQTESTLLRLVPPHRNVVRMLYLVNAAPLTPDIVGKLPEAVRGTAAPRNRQGRVCYLPTAGMFMELLPRTLEAHLQARGAELSPKEIISISLQVAAALMHLFDNGVVHGDIKLSNIMVEPVASDADAGVERGCDGDDGGRGGEAAAAATSVPVAVGTAVRTVLVGFGCAVSRGPGPADMDDEMRILATVGTNFRLGNQAHLAPEVLHALVRKSHLPRHSTEEIVIPLAAQPSFALGVLLFEISAGEHPLPGYPNVVGEMADAFNAAAFAELDDVMGVQYSNLVRELLKPGARMTVKEAHRCLSVLAEEFDAVDAEPGARAAAPPPLSTAQAAAELANSGKKTRPDPKFVAPVPRPGLRPGGELPSNKAPAAFAGANAAQQLKPRPKPPEPPRFVVAASTPITSRAAVPKRKPNRISRFPAIPSSFTKILVVGDCVTSKVELLTCFQNDAWSGLSMPYVPSVFDNYGKMILVNGNPFTVNMVDSSGTEQYCKLRTLNYGHVDVFIMLYSVALPQTLENIREIWAPEALDSSPNAALMVVGTDSASRTDRKLLESGRQFVKLADAEALATQVGAVCAMECSPKTGHNVVQVWQAAVKAAISEKRPKGETGNKRRCSVM